jgi:ribosomal protein L37AE/L43A
VHDPRAGTAIWCCSGCDVVGLDNCSTRQTHQLVNR